MIMSFVLGNIKCENGKKEKGYWNIEKTRYHIPITVICGKKREKLLSFLLEYIVVNMWVSKQLLKQLRSFLLRIFLEQLSFCIL